VAAAVDDVGEVLDAVRWMTLVEPADTVAAMIESCPVPRAPRVRGT
jgi:hypothetical protein